MKSGFEAPTARCNLDRVLEKLIQNPQEVVQAAEDRYRQGIATVCKTCTAQNKTVILLCGPSAAGKTTTSERLRSYFQSQGHQVDRISLDDFYLPASQVPCWEDGSPNFETVESLDIPRYTELMEILSKTGRASFPIFDFKDTTAKKTYTIEQKEGDVLIIEGLHALNPLISAPLDPEKVYRVYISTHTDFFAEGKVVLPAKLLRLCRRLLRDSRHRNADAEETMQMWRHIRKGEELYIHPFRNLSDIHINTAHEYEPFLYRDRLLADLQDANLSPRGEETKKLLCDMVRDIPSLSEEIVPKDSLLQEFIS